MLNVIEFTANQFQSAFQLAAALNFGLSLFRQLRQPAQEEAVVRASSLNERAMSLSNLAVLKLRDLEGAAREKCEQAGKPEIDWPDFVDQAKHRVATNKMAVLINLEEDVSHCMKEIDEKVNGWKDFDKQIEISSIVFFFVSLFCLFYSTIYSNLKFEGLAACISVYALTIMAIANFIPVFSSFLLAIFARVRLSNTMKELRRIDRELFRAELIRS